MMRLLPDAAPELFCGMVSVDESPSLSRKRSSNEMKMSDPQGGEDECHDDRESSSESDEMNVQSDASSDSMLLNDFSQEL